MLEEFHRFEGGQGNPGKSHGGKEASKSCSVWTGARYKESFREVFLVEYSLSLGMKCFNLVWRKSGIGHSKSAGAMFSFHVGKTERYGEREMC